VDLEGAERSPALMAKSHLQVDRVQKALLDDGLDDNRLTMEKAASIDSFPKSAAHEARLGCKAYGPRAFEAAWLDLTVG